MSSKWSGATQRLRGSLPLLATGAALLVVNFATVGRDWVLGNKFGVSVEADALLLGLAFPLLVKNTLGGATSGALIPRIDASLRTKGVQSAVTESANLLMTVTLVSGGLMISTILAADAVALALGPNMDSGGRASLASNLRILSTLIVTGAIRSHLAALAHRVGRFFRATATEALIPGIGALAGFVFAERLGSQAIAIGLAAGGIVDVAVMLTGIPHPMRLRWSQLRLPPIVVVKTLRRDYGPLVGAASLSGSALVIDAAMASYIAVGGPSILNYAGRLPVGVASLIAASVSIVKLPAYSALFSSDSVALLISRVRRDIVLVGAAGVAVSLTLIAVAGPAIDVLYGAGDFAASARSEVVRSLRWYSLQIPFYAAASVPLRVLNAVGRNATILRIAAVGALVNVLANLLLSTLMGVSGIALATSVVYTVTFFWLARLALRELGHAVPPS